MKRIGFIYEKVYDKNNIRNAIYNASKGKKKKRMVKWVLANEGKVIETVHEMLKNKTYIPSKYFESRIVDGLSKKERKIYKPKFYPDQIIHWSLMLQIDFVIKRGMYKWSCASVPKRGQHYAKNRVEKWIRNDFKNTKYILKLDMKKYYPSINLELLKAKFRKLIKDDDVLLLIDSIIDSHNKGLPIGNYTSQWFANFYLQDIDHFIKEKLKAKYYVRYMDDLVIFGSNKRKLRKLFMALKEKCIEEKLTIKGDWQIFNSQKRYLDFCGFVFTREKTFIRKRITRNMRRKYFKFNKNPTTHNAQSMLSYYGWVKHTDSYILYKKYFNLKLLKGALK